MRKLLLYSGLLLVVIVGVLIYNFNRQVNTTQIASWQPAKIRIPSLHVDASVLGVGATPDGKMDAPTSQALNSPYWTSVFWYELGAAPGQAGNAIIAGHVDRVGGDPAIFWSLHTLTPGARIYIDTGGETTLTYVVDSVKSYSANEPGSEAQNEVFGSTTEHRLNLITCSGAWTGTGYDQRLVVFSHQVAP